MGADKIISLEELKKVRERCRESGNSVVWTNGCFDILHLGHVRYLKKARACGDVLVVGLNSDASVKKLKGSNRPINSQAERAEILASLEAVDFVIIFDDLSPINLIAEVRPDVYAKGGDYKLDTINQDERKLVEGYGGQIALIDAGSDNSTSKIIKKNIRRIILLY